MVGVKLKHGLWILPISILAVISCIKEDFFNQNDKLNGQFRLAEARSFFEDNASDLRLVDFKTSKEGCPETKAEDLFTNIVPEWDKATQVSDERSILYEVPLKQSEQLGALMMEKRDEKTMSSKKVKVVSSLIIQKFPKIDSVRYFIVTILGEHNGKGSEKEEKPYSYKGDRRNFTGFMVISSVDGCYLASYYYGEGERKYVFLKTPEGDIKKLNKYIGFSLLKVIPKTKGGSYESGEYPTCVVPGCDGIIVNWTCTSCFAEYTPGVVCEDDGVYCPGCHNFLGQCSCHQDDDPPPVLCPNCGELYCSGDCTNGNNPGDTGGDSGGYNPPADTTYTVSISVDGGGSVTGQGEYTKGTSVTITAVPNSGYVFGGWSGDMQSSMASLSIVVNNNINLNASFKGVSNYFTFDSASDIPEIKDALLSLLIDCATRYLLDNNLYLHGQIPIEKSSSLSLFSWGPVSHTIKWNVAGFDNTNLFLIHELFHAYQQGVDTVNTGRNINNEIESFMAQYKYCEKYNLLECLPGTVQGWRDSFGAYLISPTSENYDIMINYVRNLQQGAYTESEFPDIATKRNIDNINSIFTCY